MSSVVLACEMKRGLGVELPELEGLVDVIFCLVVVVLRGGVGEA